VGDPEVDGEQHDRPLEVQRPAGAEVLPQPGRDLGKLESAAAAAAVTDLVVPVGGGSELIAGLSILEMDCLL
jgi:hypothetical protein